MNYNKNFKANLYLGCLELAELIIFAICFPIYYIYGFNKYVFIGVVAVVPFILTVLEFYPTMDIVKKIRTASYLELAEFVVFFIDLGAYIAALFLLHS